MNRSFWIRQITFTGDLVAPSSVTFKEGFNIIHGPSDTGKTYLANTIKFMLAGGTAPFSSSTGYNHVTMVLETERGQVTLERDIQSRLMTVRSHNDKIINGEFPVIPNEEKPEAYTISDLLLSFLGINERRMVVTNQYGSREPLTWRTFSDVLHRSEKRITSEASIFSKEKYATLSAFLTLFYDEDFRLVTEHADPKEVKITADILKPQLDRMLNETLRKINELSETTPENVTEAEDKLPQLLEQYAQLQEANNAYRQRLQTITHELAEANQSKVQKEVALAQYEDLATIYIGNIERLDAISDAEQQLAKVPKPTHCPYCQAPLSEHQSSQVASAVHHEALTAAHNLQDLVEQRDATKAAIMKLTQRITSLESEQADIETHLAGKLLPALQEIEDAIRENENKRDYERELDFYQDQYNMLLEELEKVPTPAEPSTLYVPSDLFPQGFYDKMTDNLRSILRELGFPNAQFARFDREDFDIRINGKRKRSHGKGMRALLNTVVLLALQKYIAEHAIHKPSVIVIDTPTLGLEHQGSGANLVTSRDEVSGRPQTGLLRNLFDYMHQAGDYGQIIILNNTDVTPTSYFVYENSTELVFGEHSDADRQGLLNDPREENADDDSLASIN